jgi:hypothetical protein
MVSLVALLLNGRDDLAHCVFVVYIGSRATDVTTDSSDLSECR